MSHPGEKSLIAVCYGCQRKRRIDNRRLRLCSGCSKSHRSYNGARPCMVCNKPTYTNFSNAPKVLCGKCFIEDLEVIKTHCMIGSNYTLIESCVNLSRWVVRAWCRYFRGNGRLPRHCLSPETRRLVVDYRNEVINFLRQEKKRTRAS